MDFIELLEEEPLFGLIRYKSGAPQDAVAFTGTLRKHPHDPEKCLLLADPSPTVSQAANATPSILEFRKADVLGMEELASPVDESGHSRQVLKLWIHRGSLGLRYEPFEVDEPLRFLGGAKFRDNALFSNARPRA
jgi:hypothetical protein